MNGLAVCGMSVDVECLPSRVTVVGSFHLEATNLYTRSWCNLLEVNIWKPYI